MTFKMSGEDYANSSLERLIDIFRKLTSNEKLVRELRSFKDERNFLSHKGITYCLDYEGELDIESAKELNCRLEAIHDEANKFRAHLWLDDISDDA